MSLADISGLRCVICGRVYGTEVGQTCPQCGPEGILDIGFEYRRVRISFNSAPPATREAGLWRYIELLPVDPGIARQTLRVGGTPLWDAPRLASFLGLRKLWLKDEGLNPTGSLKDRSSAVAVVKALEKGAKTIAGASTGNGASSLAAMAASAGLRAYVFVPQQSAESNVIQSQMHGAVVVRLDATYSEAVRLCEKACAAWGWYPANAALNPYLIEGRKTVGLEIAEAVRGEIPDWVAVPVGDGCTIAAIWKGIQEMHHLGILPHRPRMLGVQAAGISPIAEVYRTGKDLEPREGNTIADSIRVGHPANWRKAVRAVRESEGDFVTVTDEEILEAVRATARLTGRFAEPAAAAAVAGLRRAVQDRTVASRDSALAVITGTGLKNLAAARGTAEVPGAVEPDLGVIELELARRRGEQT